MLCWPCWPLLDPSTEGRAFLLQAGALVSSQPALTLAQLSHPPETSRRTGWPGALDATSEPLGAAGDQDTDVQPMGCALSICKQVAAPSWYE